MNKTKNCKGTSEIALSSYSSCALSFFNPCLFGFKIDPEKTTYIMLMYTYFHGSRRQEDMYLTTM